MTCSAPLERRQPPGEEKDDTKSIDEENKVANPPSEEQGLRGSSPPLPKDLEIWFDAWGVRRMTWYTKWTNWDRRNHRKGACDRHDYCDLVSITGDLLKGKFDFGMVSLS